MIAVPVLNWQWIVAGFLLFRFFDIVKPWPVKLADKRLPGGFGIMFDDVLAGIYALICMQSLRYYLS
jgi:phosphatidylglycerophosphatase A